MRIPIDAILRYRFLVLAATVLIAAGGVVSMLNLPIDAVPDTTPNQVVILTNAPSLSPVEVEQYLTFPVETAMTGMPGVASIQSVSKNGLSYVAVYFKDDMDVYFCRRLVMERLGEAREKIPARLGVPEMGPIATGLGEIYQFKVTGPGRSPMELRSILDWDIAPKLRTVPGVVEVNSHGGELRTYEIELDNSKLAAYGITLRKILSAIDENNANAGGAYLERFEQQELIRGEALITGLPDIENIVLGVSGTGTPILIKNVARVRFAPMVRQGFATQNGRGEIVVGVATMLIGENAGEVAGRVKERLESIRKYLPAGVRVEQLYDRTELVSRTIRTVERNLTEGGLLVIAVLLLLLGTLKGGLVVALAIPLSMLFAFIGMSQARISGNLMSLGAIDFGLIVDGSVVMVENILRRLAERNPESNRLDTIARAAREVARPVFFGVLIIMLVYVPVLLLGGVEGKMFKPMAATVLFAIAGSLGIALVLMPVLAWLVFRKPVAEKDTWLMRRATRAYAPLLLRAMRSPRITTGIAAGVFALSLFGARFLGAEFIPRLDEGSLLIQMYRLPGISVGESLHGNEIIEKVLLEFPEVESVYSRTGRAEVAIDPMAIDQSDVYIFLKPPGLWPRRRTKEDLVEAMRARLHERAPGAAYSFSQPIQMRTQEMMEAGVRSDVAVKIFGDDMDVLRQKAGEVAAVLRQVRGAADVREEKVAGMPYLRIRVRREAIARHGLDAADVLATVETIGGKVVGEVVEGNRRIPIQVRLEQPDRADVAEIRQLKVGRRRRPLHSPRSARRYRRRGRPRADQPGKRPAARQRGGQCARPRPGHVRFRGPRADRPRGAPARRLLHRLGRSVRTAHQRQPPPRHCGAAGAGGHLFPALPELRLVPAGHPDPAQRAAGGKRRDLRAARAPDAVQRLRRRRLHRAIRHRRSERRRAALARPAGGIGRHCGLRCRVSRPPMTRLRPVLMTALVASLGFLPMALSLTGRAPKCSARWPQW